MSDAELDVLCEGLAARAGVTVDRTAEGRNMLITIRRDRIEQTARIEPEFSGPLIRDLFRGLELAWDRA